MRHIALHRPDEGIDHNLASRQPLDPYVWAGYAANHHRPEPGPSATVAQPVSPTVPEPLPPTVCPKLRQVREMIAAEDAAKVRDDRMQRQEAAIQKWRSAPAESGMPHSSSLGSICAAPV